MRMDVPMELRVDVLLPVPDGGKVPDSPAVFARAPAAAASGFAAPAVVVLAEASAAAPAIAAPANTAAIASAPLDPPVVRRNPTSHRCRRGSRVEISHARLGRKGIALARRNAQSNARRGLSVVEQLVPTLASSGLVVRDRRLVAGRHRRVPRRLPRGTILAERRVSSLAFDGDGTLGHSRRERVVHAVLVLVPSASQLAHGRVLAILPRPQVVDAPSHGGCRFGDHRRGPHRVLLFL